MDYRLIITASALNRLLEEPQAQRSFFAVHPAGLCRLPDRLDWLLHDVQTPTDVEAVPRVIVVRAENHADLHRALTAQVERAAFEAPTIWLALGTGPAAGCLGAVCRPGQHIEPVSSITVVGPGMPQLGVRPNNPNEAIYEEPRRIGDHGQQESQFLSENVWSRTIGALGESTWRRLAALHVAVVGCGRSGSLVANALVRIGVRELTLVDPDLLEAHNVGEMEGVRLSQVGLPKVAALARFLQEYAPRVSDRAHPCKIHAVADSVLSLNGLVKVKRADAVFCCVDNPAARLATSFIATVYLRPLFDLGAAVLRHAGANRDPQASALPRSVSQAEVRVGADVRLVLPGQRCLLCFGGIPEIDRARTALLETGTSVQTTPLEWRQQRTGSLRSLNGLAAQLALRLLEELVATRLQESTWLCLDGDPTGIPLLRRANGKQEGRCALCVLAGRGDAAIRELRPLLERL